MTESPDERWRRLVLVMTDAWRTPATMDGVLETLLAELEPPLAASVRYGIEEADASEDDIFSGVWYRPRAEP